MWLYHGTYDMFYKSIKREGILKPCMAENKDTVTNMLDTLINIEAKRNIRGKCVYLSLDSECMDGFDFSFRVSTKNMDTSRLFVADNRKLDRILMSQEYNRIESIREYIKSYVSFKVYEDNKQEYNKQHFPEFLYFGEISIKR